MIRIITDSAADLTPQDAQRTGVYVAPMSITFEDGENVVDDGHMTKAAFYARMAEQNKLPRTSQPSPESYMELFGAAKEVGDEVVCITISQQLSGTWQCAKMAAEEVGGTVYVVDSGTSTQGEAILVREALRLRDEGSTAAEIVEALEQMKDRVRIVAVVDSLRHLHKGGRLPGAVALVGGALGIKPVIAMYQGAVHLTDKARGRPGALVAMFKQVEKQGGIDPAYGYSVIYTDEKSLTAPVCHYYEEKQGQGESTLAQLGPTMGTHIGPRAVGVVFVARG